MNNGLKKISGCDNFSRKADVIFVHGLGGDALGTWHPKGKRDSQDSWLYWLSQDIPNIGIWSLGYEAQPFAWKGSTLPLADLATNILDKLENKDIGKHPLIFITHSMGGLLVKQMLRHAMDFGTPSWKTILEQTKGIVFLSTPHSGSDLANWVNYIGAILQTTVSVDELEAHHSRLRELNHLYRNHEKLRQIPMKVYYETEKTKGVFVVNATSADPGIGGVIPIPVPNSDHLSICRPLLRESDVYEGTKKFISDNLISSNRNKTKQIDTIQLIPIKPIVLPPSLFFKDEESSQKDDLNQNKEYLRKLKLVLQEAREPAIQFYLQKQIETLEKQLQFPRGGEGELDSSPFSLHFKLNDLGINYDELRRLLEERQWKAADLETMQVMLRTAKKTRQGWLTSNDVDSIPSEDLRKIDLLWLGASKGKFGYSTQRNIWLEIQAESKNFDGSINYNSSLFLQFADQVGWRINNNLLMNYDDFNFSLTAPDGHLPTFRFPSNTDKLGKWRDSFQFFLPRL